MTRNEIIAAIREVSATLARMIAAGADYKTILHTRQYLAWLESAIA